MPDPIIDAINQESKKWWQSKTIWGLAIAAISIAAPRYQPIAQALPQGVDLVGQLIGLAIGAYGRVKADKPITK